MASNLSSLGFEVTSKEDFINLFKLSYEKGEFIEVECGKYVKWVIEENVELYGQLNKHNEPIGLNPHYKGDSIQEVNICDIITRKKGTILDGAFLCWARPHVKPNGIFPYIFDCPNFRRFSRIKLPQKVNIQISAIAHEISFYDNDEDFLESQNSEIKFASESFIPSGMFNKDNVKKDRAMAVMSGHIINIKKMTNQYTSNQFNVIIIEVQGCRFDVVIDDSLITKKTVIGGVASGSFWLTGTILGDFKEKQNKGLFRKIFGKS